MYREQLEAKILLDTLLSVALEVTLESGGMYREQFECSSQRFVSSSVPQECIENSSKQKDFSIRSFQSHSIDI